MTILRSDDIEWQVWGALARRAQAHHQWEQAQQKREAGG